MRSKASDAVITNPHRPPGLMITKLARLDSVLSNVRVASLPVRPRFTRWEFGFRLKRPIRLLIALSMIAALSQPVLAASEAVTTQPSTSVAAADSSEPAPGNSQKPRDKPHQHKKKKSFSHKLSDQVKKMRAKFPDFLNSFNKGKSAP